MAEIPPFDERPRTLLESALRHDRLIMLVLLGVIPLASWVWIVMMARDMYGPMTGASAWMMTADWDAPHLLLLWTMWSVMMTGMMLPSASPMFLLYGVIARRSDPHHAAARIYALAGGYLSMWVLFSFGATVLQRGLSELLLVTPMMEAATPRMAGVLLFLAGVYQWTPLKRACLRTCHSPMGFLMSRWRPGTGDAFRLGFEHGTYCVGCCWMLMLLLFAGGVMNLTVLVALTIFVGFEKLMPFGEATAWVSGAILMISGLWLVVP
jgi:predicted metal-binding membrane protein